jgi:hypothetical protein
MFDPTPNLELALSGSLFSISGFVAYQYENPITACMSLVLALTSIFYHSKRTPLAYWLDQIALYTVVGRGVIDGVQGGVPGIIIWFLVCGYNYYMFFSPYSNQLCFHPNKTIGKRWHATIHIASILGIILQQQCIIQDLSNLSSD